MIDDNADGADSLSAVLVSLGCLTAVAYGGEHGIAAVAQFEPDLAFVDLEMPGTDGCAVARRVRARPPLKPLKLICVTGRGQPEDRQNCMDAGFDDFLTKPTPLDSLREVVAASIAAQCEGSDSAAW